MNQSTPAQTQTTSDDDGYIDTIGILGNNYKNGYVAMFIKQLRSAVYYCLECRNIGIMSVRIVWSYSRRR